MRVSSPGYWFGAEGDWAHTHVFYNGILQNECVYADDIVGKIVRFVCDEHGRGIRDLYGSILLETRYGTVTLIEVRD